MENRKQIIIKDENYILKEVLVDSSGDTVWEITDPKRNATFLVHSFNTGKLYIKFFKGQFISRPCSLNAIRKICAILLERSLTPTITIHHSNVNLINLCIKIGFRKIKGTKQQYSLMTLY